MRITHPTTVVILGATGDLAQKKIYPALFDLWRRDLLPRDFAIIAFARREYTDDIYRDFVKDALLAKNKEETDELRAFLLLITYVQGPLDMAEGYQILAKALHAYDERSHVCSNKLFYLAVPPTLYEPIFTHLATSGLTVPCVPGENEDRTIWARILVEKPFGNSLGEAQKLDELLGSLFEDEQIYRIDHYLAKETVQNIVSFRFNNSIFEPLWRKEHIEHVEVRVLEKAIVGQRGAFYDGVGALADVGQNHLLQMLALTAIERPCPDATTALHEARAHILKHVHVADMPIVRSQYAGYREEPGVQPDSETETYFRAAVTIDSDRWRGVPFVLESGKAVDHSHAEISVFFRSDTSCQCEQHHSEHQNVLTFTIQPNEGITFTLWTKKPGFEDDTVATPLHFSYAQQSNTEVVHDAYERVLFDCIRGDRTLFVDQVAIEEQWRIVSEIKDAWQHIPLGTYTVGSPVEIIRHRESH